MLNPRFLNALGKTIHQTDQTFFGLAQNTLNFQERHLFKKKCKEENESPLVDISWQWKPRQELKKDCPRCPKCKPSFFPRIKKKYIVARDKTNTFTRMKKKKTFKEIMTIIVKDYLMAKKEEKVPRYQCQIISGMKAVKCANKKLCCPPPDWYGRTCRCKIPVGGLRPWAAFPGQREDTLKCSTQGELDRARSKAVEDCDDSRLPYQHLHKTAVCPEDRKCGSD